MGVLIIVIILVIVFMCWKSKKAPGSENQAQQRDEDEFDNYHENKNLQRQYGKLTKSMYWSLAEKNHAPQYAIDWLNYSLELGRDINTVFYYAVQSAENGMPYLCESEEEYEWLDEYLKSRRSATDITLIGFRYLGEPSASNCAHPYKLEYWRSQYMELVKQGDEKARNLLKRRADGFDVSSGFFSDNMWI